MGPVAGLGLKRKEKSVALAGSPKIPRSSIPQPSNRTDRASSLDSADYAEMHNDNEI